MRKIILVIVMFTAGCLGTSREPFDVREKVAIVSNETTEITIFEHIMGYGYWVPLQDVNRSVLTSFVIELTVHEKLEDSTFSIRSDDMMRLPHADGARFPGFLGATTAFGYWSAPTGFFVVNLTTGEIREVSCDRRFLMPGKWEAKDDQTLSRTSEHGVFEFTPEGAKQVVGEPLP
jgi:hypothetical protein